MALEESRTLIALARAVRERSRNLSSRAIRMQAALFGSEPGQPTDGGAKLPEETVEAVLREALDMMCEADSRFGRTLERVTEQETGVAANPYPRQNAYPDAGTAQTAPWPSPR